MKKYILILIIFCSISIAKSQTKDTAHYWKKGGVGSIQFTQVSLSNWAAGGENSISATSFFNAFANYRKNNISFDNNLDIAYGFLQTGKKKSKKTDDKIDFTSKFGLKASEKLFYTVLLNFKSQFAKGFNYPNDSVVTSGFMAPGYLIYSLGMDYKPNKDFSFFLSPLTGRTTFVLDQNLADFGSFGVDKAEFNPDGSILKHGKKIRYEFGGFLSIKYRKNLMQNVTLSSKIDLFTNYYKNPLNVDVNWDLMLDFKVNKYIVASISTTLIYDDDTKIPYSIKENGKDVQKFKGPRTQFKEILGIGLSYKF